MSGKLIVRRVVSGAAAAALIAGIFAGSASAAQTPHGMSPHGMNPYMASPHAMSPHSMNPHSASALLNYK